MSAAELELARAQALLRHARGQRDVLRGQLEQTLPLVQQLLDEATEDREPLHRLVREMTEAIAAVNNHRLREFVEAERSPT